jgi:hypothetical protein
MAARSNACLSLMARLENRRGPLFVIDVVVLNEKKYN